jgi:hypothetical protein
MIGDENGDDSCLCGQLFTKVNATPNPGKPPLGCFPEQLKNPRSKHELGIGCDE